MRMLSELDCVYLCRSIFGSSSNAGNEFFSSASALMHFSNRGKFRRFCASSEFHHFQRFPLSLNPQWKTFSNEILTHDVNNWSSGRTSIINITCSQSLPSTNCYCSLLVEGKIRLYLYSILTMQKEQRKIKSSKNTFRALPYSAIVFPISNFHGKQTSIQFLRLNSNMRIDQTSRQSAHWC